VCNVNGLVSLDAAAEIRKAILLETGIFFCETNTCGSSNTNVLAQNDSSLAVEIQIFLNSLEDVCVNADNYMTFSKSLLLSFYGILLTYLAVILQSVR
jgi:hypothetical protein